MQFSVTLYADCSNNSQLTLTPPSLEFDNEDYQNGAIYTANFIGLAIHESRNYEIGEFTLDFNG